MGNNLGSRRNISIPLERYINMTKNMENNEEMTDRPSSTEELSLEVDTQFTTNSDSFTITFIEFAILNEFLYENFRKPSNEIITTSYGCTDSVGRITYSGAFSIKDSWWFQSKFADSDNEYIFQTKMYLDNRRDIITELHISVKTGLTVQSLMDVYHKIKKMAFNNSKYVGKCIKVKLNESNFKGVEIVDISNFTTDLILTETQKKYIEHFISRVGRGGSARYLLNGEPGTGKAQPLTAKILTPTGWTTMGEIEVGDEVLTPEGKVSKVLGTYPQGEKDIYKISFKDGRSTEACGEHLWKVFNGKKRGDKCWSILNTFNIKDELDNGNKRLKLPLVSNLDNPSNHEFIITPYLMGVLLGDGSFNKYSIKFSTGDVQILDEIKAHLNSDYNVVYDNNYDYLITRIEGKGYKLNEFSNKLVGEIKALNLSDKKSDTKFIPSKYINTSLDNKLELLRGLMDSDGTVDKSGHLSYSTTSYQLAKDIQDLIWSIGGVCKIKEKQTHHTKTEGELKNVVNVKSSYNLNIRYSRPKELFKLDRKLNRISDNYQYSKSLKNNITSVEYVGKKEAKCIMIEDDNHLYVTDDYIVTHNTESIREIIRRLMPNVTFIIPEFTTSEDLSIILEGCEIFDNGVIIMDDIDLYLGSRDRGSYTMLLGQFLSFFDGVKKRKISLLASTNDKGLVDKAAERPGRFNMTLDYTFLTDEQIIKVCNIHLPKEYQIPEVYTALTSTINGKKVNITGAFIANLSDNIKEMAEDVGNWTTEDTVSLIKESYKGFYMTQYDKNTGIGFKTN